MTLRKGTVINMGRAFDLLAGNTVDRHNYLWEDPATEWGDKQLIAEYKQRQLTKEIEHIQEVME